MQPEKRHHGNREAWISITSHHASRHQVLCMSRICMHSATFSCAQPAHSVRLFIIIKKSTTNSDTSFSTLITRPLCSFHLFSLTERLACTHQPRAHRLILPTTLWLATTATLTRRALVTVRTEAAVGDVRAVVALREAV